MKFLTCIGGGETSTETIRFGLMIAKAFNADVSLLYVQPHFPHAVRQEMKLAREKLSEWQIDLPGVEVLHAAQAILLEEQFLKTTDSGEVVQKHALKAAIRGAHEIHLYGTRGEDVRLRLRDGDIISEVNAEVESAQHDLVILGASQQRRLLHKLIHFVNCSMLIVKNPKQVRYELLICTDGSPASRKAEVFGIRLAQSLGAIVQLLSVARSRNREHAAMEEAERVSKSMAKASVHYTIAVRVGKMVDAVAELAREDTLVVLGTSPVSELRKLLFGSIPTRIIHRINCPILIVQ